MIEGNLGFDPKPSPNNEIRSLLQKAVRRGDVDLVDKCLDCLLENGDKVWIVKRARIILFEECWSALGSQPQINTVAEARHALHIVSRCEKNKDAAALGSLAYAAATQQGVLTVPLELAKPIEDVLNGLRYPAKFWTMARKNSSNIVLGYVEMAEATFNAGGWPWDVAFILAGAYLAVTKKVVEPPMSAPSIPCPFWVAIDKHTASGKKVLTQLAHDHKLTYDQVASLTFFYEGSKVNAQRASLLWDSYRSTHFSSLGISDSEANHFWDRVKSQYESLARAASGSIERTLQNRRQPGLPL